MSGDGDEALFMRTLFESFEKRPDECSAVYVGYDNIDHLARYYHDSGYDTSVKREKGQPPTLTIQRDGDMVIVRTEQVLVYGHPPTVEEPDEFHRTWRPPRAKAER